VKHQIFLPEVGEIFQRPLVVERIFHQWREDIFDVSQTSGLYYCGLTSGF